MTLLLHIRASNPVKLHLVLNFVDKTVSMEKLASIMFSPKFPCWFRFRALFVLTPTPSNAFYTSHCFLKCLHGPHLIISAVEECRDTCVALICLHISQQTARACTFDLYILRLWIPSSVYWSIVSVYPYILHKIRTNKDESVLVRGIDIWSKHTLESLTAKSLLLTCNV